VFGMAAFPLGVALAEIEMQQPALARAVPIAVGVVMIVRIKAVSSARSQPKMPYRIPLALLGESPSGVITLV
jgi:hypothetical protein